MIAQEPSREFTLPIPTSPQLEHQTCQISLVLSHGFLTTEEKGVFLGLGCWEAVGGRWYPQKDRHPQLPEAEGDPELWQALRLPTERAEVGRQRKGREACGRPTRAEFCIPTQEGCMSCLWPGEDAPFPVPESWLHCLSLQGLTK